MLNLKNTLDGYLKNVEVIGNTVQDTNNLADIRSVGDKVEGQELYKIDIVSCGKNLISSEFEHGELNFSTGENSSNSANALIRTKDYIVVDGNRDIVFSNEGLYSKAWFIAYDKDYKYIEIFENVNKFTTPANCKYIRFRTRKANGVDAIDLSIVSSYKIQLEYGTQATTYEPYKENKLEILSPVQLEKVGDVADRIICKDGVWGVEKPIGNFVLNGSEPWESGVTANNTTRYRVLFKYIPSWDIMASKNVIGSCDKFPVYVNSQYNVDTPLIENDHLYLSIRSNILNNVEEFKTWLKNNNVSLKYIKAQTQFIPLPHDQQVKLRTFAGQTNIVFDTEIAGQVKAQVPKSLGAVVNTHTEQIEMLHNALKSVLAGDMYSLATILYPEDFTQDNSEQDIMVIPE